MAYRHGIYARELPTSIVPPRDVDSAVVFAVGAAAVHTLPDDSQAPVNTPLLFNSYDEAVLALGWDAANFNAYSLQELIQSHFGLYNAAPIVCVNVFDPKKHVSEVESEEIAFSTSLVDGDTARVAHGGVSRLALKNPDGGEYEEGKDYTVNAQSGLVVRIEGGAIAAGATVEASYVYADVSKVTPADVIGGIEPVTGQSTGLELIDEAFARYRLVPSIILAPKFCEDPAVAIVMAAKCENINGLFQAICVVDIPTDGENGVTKYQDVAAYKEKNNLTDELMLVCWPKLRLGDQVYSLSTQLAGLMAQTDGDHEGIPYASPSNKLLSAASCGYLDEKGVWREVWLDLTKANYLNGQGVHTVSNFDGGLKSWGGRMACYPSNTDPKDCQDAIRRFFNWYEAQFILTYFSKIDQPLTRRLIQTFLKSEQIRLDGFTAREIILGGSISFDETENPLTDLIDGVIRFHLRITPPPAAREVEGIFEFDPENLKSLFA